MRALGTIRSDAKDRLEELQGEIGDQNALLRTNPSTAAQVAQEIKFLKSDITSMVQDIVNATKQTLELTALPSKLKASERVWHASGMVGVYAKCDMNIMRDELWGWLWWF